MNATDPERQGLERLSWLMDASIRLPGGYRIGWDAIIGLVPGLGDLAGGAVSLYILFGAIRSGASIPTLLRMGVNIGLEMLFGAIPVIGNLFDMAFKSNLRNMALLESQLDQPERTDAKSRRLVLLVGLLITIVLLAVAALVVRLLISLFAMIF